MPVRHLLPPLLCCISLLGAQALHAAEFRVYGKLHAGYAQLDSGKGGSTAIVNDERSNSRLGVEVQHPLGDNIGGLGRVELGFDPTNWDSDDDPISMREAWVGIQGNLGRLTVGRIGSAYKTTGGTGWDPMNSTLLQQRRTGGASGGQFGHNSYVNRAVEYLTPSFAGLQLKVQLGLDKRNDGGNDGNYTVGLSLREGPWELIGAWARDDSADSGETRNWKTGIRYAAPEGTLLYRYEDVRIRDRLDLAGSPDDESFDIADLLALPLDFNTRHHLVGLQQNYASSRLWLAVGYMNASEEDFDVISYTGSWTWLISDALSWYIGYQHQDRDRGYETGRLNVVASGLNLDF
ncbi:MAG: porin [Ectothiorhodospiraceae bacterium]|nr:porin [Ectothiorhodospiraceae bacterium]